MQHLTPEELKHATPAERKAYAAHLERELARSSPLDLMCWLNPKTVRAPHLEYLNEHIVALVEYRLYASGPGPAAHWCYRAEEDGPATPALDIDHIPEDAHEWWGQHPETAERVIFRLAIAMPPRHGKSFLVSEYLPLWYWLRYPDNHIAFATYSDDFAASWGKKLRDKILEYQPKLGLTLRNGERHSATELSFKETSGEMFLVGTGGALTGKGWQLGIIDDPIKDAAAALSVATRNAIGEWYASTFDTRDTRLPGRGIPVQIMMFTRWHEDDLAGRYVYDDKKRVRPDWYMLRLPALAEEGDPLGREPGEALWPRVKNRQQLLKIKERDPLWFSAQFQGSPTLGDQGMFPRFYTYRDHAGVYVYGKEDARRCMVDECVRYATADTAYTTSTWSDYSVFAVWDWHRASQTLFLVDVVRQRVESPELEAWLRQHSARHNVKFVGIEDQTSGKQLIQQIQRRGGLTIRPLKADKDKVSRALPYAQAVALGQVLIPAQAPWASDWLEEHTPFPYGTHDDMVDSGSYGWRVAADMPHAEVTERHIVDMSLEGKVHRHLARLDAKDKGANRRKPLISGRLGR